MVIRKKETFSVPSYFQSLGSKVNLTVNAGASVFNRRNREEYQSTDGLIVPFLYSLGNTQRPVIITTPQTSPKLSYSSSAKGTIKPISLLGG
jgi:hypothetical protein